MVKYLLFCIFLCLKICYAYGQITTIRENLPSDDYQFALDLYNNAVKNQELVFTGSEYKAMTGKLTGHPYFDFDHFVEDTIVFDGMIFPDIPLQYDIVKDELVIKYIIVKYNKTHHITSKKSLFKALDDKEKELSTYAREEKLRFKKQKEEDMINLIEYYDQIAH